MKCIIIFYILLGTVCFTVSGQQFKYLRPREGLNDGEINSIVQDSSGLMWFATWSGLISYDGYNFNTYRPELGNPHSLPGKKIKILHVDRENNLWVGTSRDLAFHNRRQNTFRTVKFGDDPAAAVNILNLWDAEGFLIVHAVDGFYALSDKPDLSGNLIARKISVFMEGVKVNIHFHYSAAFSSGIFLVSNNSPPEKSQVWKATLSGTADESVILAERLILSDYPVNALEFSQKENNLYLASTSGIYTFSMVTGTFYPQVFFRGIDIRSLLLAEDNRLYAAARNPELMYIDLHTGSAGSYQANPNQPGTLLNNNIHSLFADFSGNLWIGHQGQGISILNLLRKEFHTIRRNPFNPNTLASNSVMCFGGTDEEILIGCRTGGLNILNRHPAGTSDPDFGHIDISRFLQSLGSHDGVWDICMESDTIAWLGSDAGLLKLIKEHKQWRFDPGYQKPVYSGAVRKIFLDRNKNIWLGTMGDGLLFVPALSNNREGRYFRFINEPGNEESLSDDVVISMLLDSRSNLWIGTGNGLNRVSNYESLDLSGITPPKIVFNRFVAEAPVKNYLNNNEINAIFENLDGRIWLATQGGGINIYNPVSGLFSHLTARDGLPSDDVLGILPDERGNLWISTTRGLVCYSQFKDDPVVKTYSASEGIQGEIFMVNSFFKASDGEMFFGGDNGFTRFYPAKIKDNPIRPRVLFTGLKVNQETLQIGDTISDSFSLDESLNHIPRLLFPFSKNSFSIGVSAVHFQDPLQNRIAYQLEGFDEAWKYIPASQGYIEFSNIPSGRYILKVKAVSPENVESAEVRVLPVEISPPWYRTWYFGGLFIVLLASLAAGFFMILVNRQRLLYQKRLDRIRIESSEGKMVFLTNIAHELRTPLSLIISPIEDMVRNSNEARPEMKQNLRLIYRNSRYLQRLINQIIDFNKLDAGKLQLKRKEVSLNTLVREVAINFQEFERRKEIEINLDFPGEDLVLMLDPQKVEEILYNLISNAFKNTFPGHAIVISLKKTNAGNNGSSEAQYAVITVFNQGLPIPDEQKEAIFQRFYKINEQSDGAGIGLAYSKSLAEMHGGFIQLESQKDKGVSFHVYLPYVKDRNLPAAEIPAEDFPEEDEKATLFPGTGGGSQPYERYSVVLVEDNGELRNFLMKVLSRNYECHAFGNGNEALEAIPEIMPDVVVADIVVPGMDGLALCRNLKGGRSTCHIPVILLTARDSEERVVEGFEAGADAYITKPFSTSLLLSQMSRMIQNRELIREKYLKQNFMVEIADSLPSRDDAFLAGLRRILEEHIQDADFNVNSLSKQMNISTTQLYRKLKTLTGHSPVEFMRIVKLQKACELLKQRNNTVKEVCFLVGFNNLSYFVKCFREFFGVTPAVFRDQGLTDYEKPETNSFLKITEEGEIE